MPQPRTRSPDGVTTDWGGRHLIAAYYSQKDKRQRGYGWLTYRGRFAHISGHLSAVGRVQDRESLLVRLTFYRCAAQPCSDEMGFSSEYSYHIQFRTWHALWSQLNISKVSCLHVCRWPQNWQWPTLQDITVKSLLLTARKKAITVYHDKIMVTTITVYLSTRCKYKGFPELGSSLVPSWLKVCQKCLKFSRLKWSHTVSF